MTSLTAGNIEETITLGKGVISQVVFSPDGNQIALSSSTGIWIYDAKSLKEISEFATDDWISSLAYSPDGKMIAAWYPDGSVGLWDVKTSTLQQTLKVESEGNIRFTGDGLNNVAFSADGKVLASGHGDGSVHLWDTVRGELIRTIKGSETSIQGIAISPDGKLLASTAIFEGVVRVWDMESGELVKEVTITGSPMLSQLFTGWNSTGNFGSNAVHCQRGQWILS